MKIKYLKTDKKYSLPFGIELTAGKNKSDSYLIEQFKKGVKVVYMVNDEPDKVRFVIKDIIQEMS